MPKDPREIIQAVRLSNPKREDGRAVEGVRPVFTAGMEDELEEAADAKTLKRLEESGAISGFASVKRAEEPKAAGKK